MRHRAALPGEAIRTQLEAELSRRQFLQRAGVLGLGAVVLSAVPVAERLARPEPAYGQDVADGTLQAFFDTMIPGRKAELTELGNPIHPQAIAGVDPEPGAVEADALLLAHNPKIGFDALEGPLLAELEARSVSEGGGFLGLDYEARERVCLGGLDFDNSTRALWEAGAAVAFTAFTAAGNIPNASGRRRARHHSVGYAVMGYPGTARHGYRHFSYRKRLNRGRTRGGNLS